MTVHEFHPLKAFNTFGVEADARYFVRVTSLEELKEALELNQRLQTQTPGLEVPLFLGQGSNILFTKDYKGLVIKLDLKGIEIEFVNESEVLVSAMAGENWHEFVLFTLSKNFGGLENLSLIPGNVGTSPMQNIGAYGTEIKDVFESCTALNLQTRELEKFSLDQAQFGYRESFFKREGKGNYALVQVCFRLTTKDHNLKTDYGAITTELEVMGIKKPTIKDVSNAVIAIRQSKLPDPQKLGNAGSFFKNPTVSQSEFDTLQAKFPELPHYPTPKGQKIPAAYLIEQCGWKGKQIGNAASHATQALVLVNKTGKASGKELFDFSGLIIQSVHSTYGITLEREVNIV